MPVARIVQAAIAMLLCLMSSTAGHAATGAWNINDHVDTRLVSVMDAVGDADSVRLGLHFRMRPGWKIYWRSPGDAGFPPDPDWAGCKPSRRSTSGGMVVLGGAVLRSWSNRRRRPRRTTGRRSPTTPHRSRRRAEPRVDRAREDRAARGRRRGRARVDDARDRGDVRHFVRARAGVRSARAN